MWSSQITSVTLEWFRQTWWIVRWCPGWESILVARIAKLLQHSVEARFSNNKCVTLPCAIAHFQPMRSVFKTWKRSSDRPYESDVHANYCQMPRFTNVLPSDNINLILKRWCGGDRWPPSHSGDSPVFETLVHSHRLRFYLPQAKTTGFGYCCVFGSAFLERIPSLR